MDLIIAHGSCSDGFTAAWAVRKKFPTAEVVFAVHGEAPPDVVGKDVVIVDFAYPRKVTEELKVKSKSLLILDHHKSAMEDLAGLDYCYFDLTRSGAKIAWEHFHPGEACALVDYVSDQDLWKFALPYSKETNAFIQSFERTWDNWETLQRLVEDSKCHQDIINGGNSILRYQEQLIQEAIRSAREVSIPNYHSGFFGWFWNIFDPLPSYNVLVTNTLGDFRSEVASRLAMGRPFGICWRQLTDGRFAYSLRTHKDSPWIADLTQVAKQFGGGGHPSAAAFTSRKLIF